MWAQRKCDERVIYYDNKNERTSEKIATEWRGCTPGAVSGMECTISLTLNTAGGKSSIGAGRAAAAVKIK